MNSRINKFAMHLHFIELKMHRRNKISLVIVNKKFFFQKVIYSISPFTFYLWCKQLFCRAYLHKNFTLILSQAVFQSKLIIVNYFVERRVINNLRYEKVVPLSTCLSNLGTVENTYLTYLQIFMHVCKTI